MKNILITGSNGMIGNLILQKCLASEDVKQVTILVRKPSGFQHPKLKEVLHGNFLDYSGVEDFLKNQDVCFYCIGVYTGQVPPAEFRKITVDFTKSFGETLKQNSPRATFCFLSGQGVDPQEKSRIMFARDKGAAENSLLNLKFEAIHFFRPGYIYPTVKRKEPNLMYKILRVLYKPILSKIYPNFGITSEQLAQAMVEVGLKGNKNVIFENKDIRTLTNSTSTPF